MLERPICSRSRSPRSSPDMAVRRGVVVEFDAHVGLGVVEADGERIPFHCVEIADGSRNVVVGESVEFEVREKFSRPEAFTICRSGD
ncbi:MAG: hypothetical protein B7C54_07810 [Acidimicrobiales bacterium mtb01]|nr:hypothetical protein [Actinomycetota bacterium]TEX45031.1 MAG: hypothetical protein B7C54_07810 [Acidimicrobiales bacterium mtb01]